MSDHKKEQNRGQRAPGLNPQGYDRYDDIQDPKSELENRAKKSNTKG